MNQKECVDNGGHCWEYHHTQKIINEDKILGRLTEPSLDYRVCKHCGKKQLWKPAEWIDD